MSLSMEASTASGSFFPSQEKILIPLSGQALCEAETEIPASAPSAFTRCATAGVGTTPAKRTSAPAARSPPARAATIPGEETRVSQPTTTVSVPVRPLSRSETARAAPIRETVAGSSGYSPALPRIPSVPKRERMFCGVYGTGGKEPGRAPTGEGPGVARDQSGR